MLAVKVIVLWLIAGCLVCMMDLFSDRGEGDDDEETDRT